LKCATCHRVRGEGAVVGPDLSNLVSRDAASTLRDIKEPSASINPDYVGYKVSLNDESELTGFVRAHGNNSLQLLGIDGKETTLQHTAVKEMRPSGLSLMPSGLLDHSSENDVRDLLTFLLHAPPQRTHAQVESAVATSSISQTAVRTTPLKIVLIASKQDHGPGEHDYPAWQKSWSELLGTSNEVSTTTAQGWPTEEQFQNSDVLMFYYWNHDWNTERLGQLDKFLARGGGLVLLHAATIADKNPEGLAERIGLASQSVLTKYIHAPFDLEITGAEHPLTRGLPRQIPFLDEPYWPMIGDTNRVQVIATARQEGKSWPMAWTVQHGKGRVFATVLGHYTWTHNDPLYRMLVLRGLAWSAGEPIHRFDELVKRRFTAGK
jgi:putative heme-binding domain-containing protein